MSLNTFKLTNPGVEGVRLYLASGNSVTALTVSSTGCDGKNYAPSLEVLESITVNGVELIVTAKEVYTGYYFYETEPTEFNPNSDTLVTGSCTGIIFNPFLQEVDFTYNDYNALLGNSSELKQSGYIYEVDRKVNQIIPSNLSAILSGSAVRAEVQDSNYSSIGFTNGRYTGTKTTVQDFRIEPAINATLFTGEDYILEKAGTDICSKSLSDRNIEEFLFSPNLLTQGSATAEYPSVRYQWLRVRSEGVIEEDLQSEDTVINFYKDMDVNIGDIILINTDFVNTGSRELMKIQNVSKTPTPVTSSLTVQRRYYSNHIEQAAAFNWTAGASQPSVRKVLGDTIYDNTSDQVFKITEKKLWIEKSEEVVIVDTSGTIIGVSETCST